VGAMKVAWRWPRKVDTTVTFFQRVVQPLAIFILLVTSSFTVRVARDRPDSCVVLRIEEVENLEAEFEGVLVEVATSRVRSDLKVSESCARCLSWTEE
jgi:hypothetical protein